MQSEGIFTSYYSTTNCIKPYMLYSMALLGYQNVPHLMIPRRQTSADCTEVFVWFATHLSLWRFRSFSSTSAEWVGSCWISVIQEGVGCFSQENTPREQKNTIQGTESPEPFKMVEARWFSRLRAFDLCFTKRNFENGSSKSQMFWRLTTSQCLGSPCLDLWGQ